jgi:hypothetical protein
MVEPAFTAVGIESFSPDRLGPSLVSQIDEKIQRMALEVATGERPEWHTGEVTVMFCISRESPGVVNIAHSIIERHPPPQSRT